MKQKRSVTLGRTSAKKQRAEDIAAALGVSGSAVWKWRRTNSLPYNAKIREQYLRIIGKTKSKAVAP